MENWNKKLKSAKKNRKGTKKLRNVVSIGWRALNPRLYYQSHSNSKTCTSKLIE